jgi:hypothetical protein
MLPLIRFKEFLETMKDQFNEDMDEMITGATILGTRPNYLTVDEQGFYHAQASGTSLEVIQALEILLEKVKRIQAQKDTP